MRVFSMQRDSLLLTEMINAADRVIDLVGESGAAELDADEQRRDAILWNLTVLGEAATQVSDDLKTNRSEVVWSDPIRLRNRLVHGYWSIEMEVVVATAADDLPPLLTQLRAVLESLDEA